MTTQKKAYISLDVEAAGPDLLRHSTLSIGASLITPEHMTYEERLAKGLAFYVELIPQSSDFDMKAMRVGCLHLECFKGLRRLEHRFDASHSAFDPAYVLEVMRDESECMSQHHAAKHFADWVRKVAGNNAVEGVTDTVFFDAARIEACFASSSSVSPFGWKGLDLDSMYRGYTADENAKLKELGESFTNEKPHHAGHDAVFQGHIAARLFQMLGWEF